jgi:hypothetical protein
MNAILQGERVPMKLVGLRDGRIGATEQTIAKALVGFVPAQLANH